MAKAKMICLECGIEYYPLADRKGGPFCSKKCRNIRRRKQKAKQLFWNDSKRKWVKLDD